MKKKYTGKDFTRNRCTKFINNNVEVNSIYFMLVEFHIHICEFECNKKELDNV